VEVNGGWCLLISPKDLVDCFKRYEVLARTCLVTTKPKLHMFMHLTAKARTDGNPTHLACFLDESLNGVLARVCRAAYRAVWHDRVFANFEQCEMRRRDRSRKG